MKKWIICIVSQFIAWSLFTFTDWIQETSGATYFTEVFIWSVIILGITYFVFRKRIYSELPVKWKEVWGLVAGWTVTGLVLGFFIFFLICQWNVWFIRQAAGEGHLLNGIEYMLYAIWIAAVPAVTIILGEAEILLFHKIRNK